jgi:hypothetical protein
MAVTRTRFEETADREDMTVPLQSAAPRVIIRPLALPVEHGGWGFVIEPAVLALLVVPSRAGLMIGIAAVAAFLARHPLRLAAGDWTRRRRFPRTIVCERLALGYGSLAIAAMAIAMTITDARILLPFAIAVPLGLAQFVFDVRNRGHAIAPEIAGAVAAGATAAAIVLAGGRPLTLAATLWLLTVLRSVPAIVFVRAVLGRESRAVAVILHVAAVVIAILLWYQRLAPVAAIVAMSLLLARALIPTKQAEPPRRIGMRELVFGAVTVILIGTAM